MEEAIKILRIKLDKVEEELVVARADLNKVGSVFESTKRGLVSKEVVAAGLKNSIEILEGTEKEK